MAGELLDDGIIIMVLGMGMVFSFLIILMLAIIASRAVAEKIDAAFSSSKPQKPLTSGKRSVKGSDADTSVAIAVALAYHMKNAHH